MNNFLNQRPNAIAQIKGSPQYSRINGTVKFYNTNLGVIVFAEINGLPTSNDPCSQPIFAFHIHSGTSCSGNETDYFANALTHYNPRSCQHPYHAGDMPPLFGVNGTAILVFLTGRFSINEVIGKTVIIHSGLDDFTTQPSGNAGTKIACGVIK